MPVIGHTANNGHLSFIYKLGYSFSNSSRDLSIVFDLLLGKTKDRLPAVSGKRSRVTVFGFSLAGKVQTQSGCTFPARAQG